MIGRFSLDNRILRSINGLRYTRQPCCIIRVSSVPRLRAVIRRGAVGDRYRGAVIDIVLDQHGTPGRCSGCDTCHGAGHRRLLPRTSALRGDRGAGGRVPVQRGGHTARGNSPAPYALHHAGRDQHRLVDRGYGPIGIGLGAAGCRYWALVALSITSPLVATIGFWVTAGWLPWGMPRRRIGIRSMMPFWRNPHPERRDRLCRLQCRKSHDWPVLGADAIGLYVRPII